MPKIKSTWSSVCVIKFLLHLTLTSWHEVLLQLREFRETGNNFSLTIELSFDWFCTTTEDSYKWQTKGSRELLTFFYHSRYRSQSTLFSWLIESKFSSLIFVDLRSHRLSFWSYKRWIGIQLGPQRLIYQGETFFKRFKTMKMTLIFHISRMLLSLAQRRML